MKNHKVYFEFYGKKMKTTVLATSKEDARKIVTSRIIFHGVIAENEKPNDEFKQKINDIFGGIFDKWL